MSKACLVCAEPFNHQHWVNSRTGERFWWCVVCETFVSAYRIVNRRHGCRP